MRLKKIFESKLPSKKDICFFILNIFMIDSTFHLTRYFFNGGNLIRIILLGIMTVFSLSKILYKPRIRLRKINIAILFLVFLLLIGYCKSLILGGNMLIAQEYITNGFIYLLFLPIMYYSVDSIEKCELLLKNIAVMGLITSVLSTMLTITNLTVSPLYHSLAGIMRDMEMVSIISPLDGKVRAMLSGMVFQILAIFIGIYFFVKGGKKLVWFGIFFLNFIGLSLTYSRGLIAGTIIALIAWVLISSGYDYISKKNAKAFMAIALLGIGAIAIYMINGEHGDVFGYVLDRFLGKSSDNTASSDIFRITMNRMINKKILEAPLLGSGLGGHIDLRDGVIEMTFQDIIIRIGVVGLIVFMYPYFKMLLKLPQKSNYRIIRGIVFCALTAVMIAAYSNPYLITSLGIFLYCLCIRIFSMSS